jgi:hypothetical protein
VSSTSALVAANALSAGARAEPRNDRVGSLVRRFESVVSHGVVVSRLALRNRPRKVRPHPSSRQPNVPLATLYASHANAARTLRVVSCRHAPGKAGVSRQRGVMMDAWVWILIVVVAIAAVAAVAYWFTQRYRRRRALRERFGPEYDRSVDSSKSRRKAEGQLAERAERREKLDIRPLPDDARARYLARWNEIQGRFVDRPQVAVVEADDLVTQVMRDRGYPVDDFESQSDLVSVDHPHIVQKYRVAHGIYTRATNGETSTEDLRRAVVAYRDLFEELATDRARSGEHSRS